MKNAIEVRNLTKHYKNFSLDHISFDVPSGSIVGLVGENGAGKSTTLKAILNLIYPEEGTIKIFGKENTEDSLTRNQEIGVVFDECMFPGDMKLEQVGKMLSCIYANWDQRAFDMYQQKFRLPLDKCIKDFSRGMKMKTSIAGALSHNAKLLILDEATSGLDPMVRDEILDIFLDFIQDEEHSVLVSTHIISDLEKIADYITFIHDGKIHFSESKDELIYKYGIVRCNEKEYKNLEDKHIAGVKRNSFGYEVLVDNKPELEKRAHSFVIDKAGIEDIMLFMTKGELQ
ncbi:ABC transporter ATP-binding protein [Murimonas intestini]|uniref:ABC-2 type transport system ATP-binding protein n=1 Tax=Murimonas intestini TaxID=1337051 RepID=A0AB73T9A0_9FIRM|nr:ABC transporter ATP-binding protein [Murimonas intestini]MCR1839326.1 ABC transporter ATP-binding protein [Murimonas intestini]MCR1864621.1 ABC transporter ATP-binding protein [Murimonas intestini]MCR1882231.1 ABC transporter ATP-binding protein [Murimonas intestini]